MSKPVQLKSHWIQRNNETTVIWTCWRQILIWFFCSLFGSCTLCKSSMFDFRWICRCLDVIVWVTECKTPFHNKSTTQKSQHLEWTGHQYWSCKCPSTLQVAPVCLSHHFPALALPACIDSASEAALLPGSALHRQGHRRKRWKEEGDVMHGYWQKPNWTANHILVYRFFAAVLSSCSIVSYTWG